MKHTDELLASQGIYIYSKETYKPIASADYLESSLEQGYVNAERIVACVNACKGISNKALRDGITAEMIRRLKGITEELDLALAGETNLIGGNIPHIEGLLEGLEETLTKLEVK